MDNPLLQNACRKAIEFLKDDEADLILSQMLPGYIGFKTNEDIKTVAKTNDEKPIAEVSQKVQIPTTTDPPIAEKPRPKRGRPKQNPSVSETSAPVTQSPKTSQSLEASETVKKSAPENQDNNKLERRRTRSNKKAEPSADEIEVVSVETVAEEKPISDSGRVTRKRAANQSESSIQVKKDEEVIIITDPKPERKTERPKRTRTSSSKADLQLNLTSVPPVSTPIQEISKKDEKAPTSPRVTITNPPNVNKIIRDEIKKRSPKNSPSIKSGENIPEDTNEGIKSPRPTRSTRTTSQNNQSSNPEQLEETAKYKMGDLVWVKWSDTRPYGAIIVGYMANDEGYKLRFALDGVEKEFKLERITGLWNPVEHLTDDFGNYFDTMYRNSDAKEVRLGLIAAKVAFENGVKDFKSIQKASLKAGSKTASPKIKTDPKITPTKSDIKLKSTKLEMKSKQVEPKIPDSKNIQKSADQPVRKSFRISS